MRLRDLLLAALAIVCSVAAADDQVKKCVAPDGAVIYTNQECPSASRQQASPARQDARQAPRPAVPRDMKALADQINADVDRALKRRQEELAKAPPSAVAQPESASVSSSTPATFPQCKEAMRASMLSLAGRATTHLIVSSPEMAVVKFCLQDGALVVTCSAPDGLMITTRSPDRC